MDPQVGRGRVSANHLGKATCVSSIDGDSDMAQKKNIQRIDSNILKMYNFLGNRRKTK